MAKFSAAVAVLVLIASGSADAFSSSGMGRCKKPDTRLSMATLPTPEESAKALSDYMAKSHQEKLKAVKEAEDKYASQIEALKKEIEELKSSRETSMVQSSALPPASLPEGSKEDLTAKLMAYQKFMAEYIVKAQEQKLEAVKAAEAAAENKFQEKLLAFSQPEASAAANAATAAPALSKNQAIFQQRNKMVSAAGKAGKSRWGEMEINRATEFGGKALTAAVAAADATPSTSASPLVPVVAVDVPVPPEVEAADHGLRADGGVGGLSLAQRVALGATASQTVNGAVASGAVATAFQ